MRKIIGLPLVVAGSGAAFLAPLAEGLFGVGLVLAAVGLTIWHGPDWADY